MNVSKRIKELREKAGYSNRQLGIKADIPQTIINRLERGAREADVPILEKICAALNITLKDFFDVEDGEDINLNPEYIKLMKIAKELPEEKLKVLNNVAESFKETTFVIGTHEIKIKQEANAPEIPKEDLLSLINYLKNNNNDKKEP